MAVVDGNCTSRVQRKWAWFHYHNEQASKVSLCVVQGFTLFLFLPAFPFIYLLCGNVSLHNTDWLLTSNHLNCLTCFFSPGIRVCAFIRKLVCEENLYFVVCLHLLFLCSDEEGEEILRQRGQLPALPFATGNGEYAYPKTPREVDTTTSNGSTKRAFSWENFSANNTGFKYPGVPPQGKFSGNTRTKRRNSSINSEASRESSHQSKHYSFMVY